jgi:pimeloyl-ACP methyl ester carboxylesterase
MALPVLLGATLPSVDDCSRSAPLAPTQGWLECLGMGGWLPSESPAGISRNARLECVGIRTPTLVIAATGDPHAYPAAPRVAAVIAGAELVEIAGGTVPLPDAMPAALSAAILEFLRRRGLAP